MSTDQGPDLRPSYLQHRAMRVDAARLPDLVAAARPSDADRLVGLAAWYTRFEQAIHDHHTAEEAVVYPALWLFSRMDALVPASGYMLLARARKRA